MSFPYKLAAFDLDGTLGESKLPITPEMAALLSRLARTSLVAVISGGSFARFEAQLLSELDPTVMDMKRLVLLPTNGAQRFEYDSQNAGWKRVFLKAFPEGLKERALMALGELMSLGEYEIPVDSYGERVEDRETQITFSALGQEAPLAEKAAWDPDQRKRQKIRAALEEKLPEASIAIAGTTSIDILPKGFDKAAGLELLLRDRGLTAAEVIFAGDAVFPGGNDYSVSRSGIKTVRVAGPEATAELIRSWL
jgi:phosphomannomutase